MGKPIRYLTRKYKITSRVMRRSPWFILRHAKILLALVLLGTFLMRANIPDLYSFEPISPLDSCAWSSESKRLLGHWSSECNDTEEELRLKKFLDPPKLDASSISRLRRYFRNESSAENIERGEQHLSTLIQQQIDAIQKKSCDQPNFQCGFPDKDGGGFGYQLRHRIACLIMSYVLSMPLIHTVDDDGWYYTHPWNHVFLPLGSNCTPGPNTYVWNWINDGCSGEVSKCHNVLYNKHTHTAVPYPLSFWDVFDESISPFLDVLFGTNANLDEFVWVIGQFAKYTMRLNTTLSKELSMLKNEIGFSQNRKIVGLHVRCTDKVTEFEKSLHPLSLYFEHAEEYFRNLETQQSAGNETKIPRAVYLSSDNSSILQLARESYPTWEIIGFPSISSEQWSTRKHGVFEIIRDIIFLSECDYVICGFSSNVCELVFEMQSWKYYRFKHGKVSAEDGSDRLRSLDSVYYYNLCGIKLYEN